MEKLKAHLQVIAYGVFFGLLAYAFIHLLILILP